MTICTVNVLTYLSAWKNFRSDFPYLFCDLSKIRYKRSHYGFFQFLERNNTRSLTFLMGVYKITHTGIPLNRVVFWKQVSPCSSSGNVTMTITLVFALAQVVLGRLVFVVTTRIHSIHVWPIPWPPYRIFPPIFYTVEMERHCSDDGNYGTFSLPSAYRSPPLQRHQTKDNPSWAFITLNGWEEGNAVKCAGRDEVIDLTYYRRRADFFI